MSKRHNITLIQNLKIMKFLFLLLGFVSLIYGIIVMLGLSDLDFLNKRKASFLAIPVGIVFIFLALSMRVVNSDERGLRFTFGAISPIALNPGLQFNMPFVQTIKTVSIRPMEIVIDIPVSEEGAITKDNQTIGARLTIFYAYDPAKLPIMWKDYGIEKIEVITEKTAMQAFKSAVGKYDIFVLPMTQDTIRLKTFRHIKDMMIGYPVIITELKITNYDWSDDFDNQIKETMNRSQQVKQKEQELLITEQESQKLVKKAEAERTALVTRAQGEKEAASLRADAKALEGEGIKKYNISVASNREFEIELRKLRIEERRVEKWNGQYVPNNNYGPIPIQSGSMQGAKSN